jgi:hypothetical protein
MLPGRQFTRHIVSKHDKVRNAAVQGEGKSNKPAPRKDIDPELKSAQRAAAPGNIYIGRNDGKEQHSTTVGKASPRNLTTNAKPSSEITANAAPPSFVGRSSGVAKQTGAGAHKTKGPQQIATQSGAPADGSPKWHKYQDGQLPGSGPAGGSASGASQGQGKPAGAPFTTRNLRWSGAGTLNASPTPRPGLGRQPNFISTIQDSLLQPASGKGKGENVSPTPRPR